MTEKTRSRARTLSSFLIVLLAVGALITACSETRRAVGEDCIRDDDCLTNYCQTKVCTVPAPGTDTPALPTPDASGDGGDGSPDSAGDAETGGDSGDADGPPVDVNPPLDSSDDGSDSG